MSTLFSRAKGVLLVQVEISKGVVDHSVMGLVRPEIINMINMIKTRICFTFEEKIEIEPDGQYDVPHQRLVRELPVVDGNFRSRQ